jgi:hypothetical protein
MERPSLSLPSTGQVFERNEAVGGSSQTFGNRGNHQTVNFHLYGRSSGQRSERTTPNDSRRVSDQYELPNITPYDPHHRANSPDRGRTNCGGWSPERRPRLTTATGSRNDSASRHWRPSKALTVIILVIIAIVIAISVAVPIVLKDNARSSEEK